MMDDLRSSFRNFFESMVSQSILLGEKANPEWFKFIHAYDQFLPAIFLQGMDVSILTLPLCSVRSSTREILMLGGHDSNSNIPASSLDSEFFLEWSHHPKELHVLDMELHVECFRNHLEVRLGEGPPTSLGESP